MRCNLGQRRRGEHAHSKWEMYIKSVSRLLVAKFVFILVGGLCGRSVLWAGKCGKNSYGHMEEMRYERCVCHLDVWVMDG